jgi:hypothetical protein
MTEGLSFPHPGPLPKGEGGKRRSHVHEARMMFDVCRCWVGVAHMGDKKQCKYCMRELSSQESNRTRSRRGSLWQRARKC